MYLRTVIAGAILLASCGGGESGRGMRDHLYLPVGDQPIEDHTISSVAGDVIIDFAGEESRSITLSSLTEVGGGIYLAGTQCIPTMVALPNLVRAGGLFVRMSCVDVDAPALSSLEALELRGEHIAVRAPRADAIESLVMVAGESALDLSSVDRIGTAYIQGSTLAVALTHLGRLDELEVRYREGPQLSMPALESAGSFFVQGELPAVDALQRVDLLEICPVYSSKSPPLVPVVEVGSLFFTDTIELPNLARVRENMLIGVYVDEYVLPELEEVGGTLATSDNTLSLVLPLLRRIGWSLETLNATPKLSRLALPNIEQIGGGTRIESTKEPMRPCSFFIAQPSGCPGLDVHASDIESLVLPLRPHVQGAVVAREQGLLDQIIAQIDLTPVEGCMSEVREH